MTSHRVNTPTKTTTSHVPFVIKDAVLQVCDVTLIDHGDQMLLFDTRYHTDVSTHKRSFFKSLVDQEVTVELKNDISIRGTLKSVDQYLNIKLDAVQVMDELKFPHLVRPTKRFHQARKKADALSTYS